MVRGMLYYKTDHAMILSKRKLVRPLKVQDDDYSLLPAPRQLGYMVSGCPSVLPSRQRITASSEVAQNRDTGWAGGSNRTFPPSLPIIHDSDTLQLLEASTGSGR